MICEASAPPAPPTTQRIDKWLWCARFFKTRSLAGKVAAAGGLRLTREGATMRVEKASTLIRVGDRIAFFERDRLRVIEVTGCVLRRGPAAEARRLYIEHSAANGTKGAVVQNPA